MTLMDDTQAPINVTTLFSQYHDEKKLMNLHFSKNNSVEDDVQASKYKLKSVKRLVSTFLEKQQEKSLLLAKEKEESLHKENVIKQAIFFTVC
jgi:hypothetical protein